MIVTDESRSGDEPSSAVAEAIDDARRRAMELTQRLCGSGGGAGIQDEPVAVHGVAEDTSATFGETTDKHRNGLAETPEGGKGGILVVDDEDTVRDILKEMLASLRYVVACVQNGQEAVDYYTEHGDEIDLVLLDLTMPVMNGWYCFHALRGLNPEVKVLLSTGHVFDGVAQGMLEEGVVGFIQKPYVIAQLSEAVAKALRRRRGR